MALIFLWTATFESILIYSGATMALNSMFVVFGVFIIRRRNKGEKEGVFNTPLFPLPPIIFIAISATTLIYLAMQNTAEILFSLATIAVGGVFYIFAHLLSDKRTSATDVS